MCRQDHQLQLDRLCTTRHHLAKGVSGDEIQATLQLPALTMVQGYTFYEERISF